MASVVPEEEPMNTVRRNAPLRTRDVVILAGADKFSNAMIDWIFVREAAEDGQSRP